MAKSQERDRFFVHRISPSHPPRFLCEEVHTVATNLVIDPDLLERALAVGEQKAKTATVNSALEESIARRAQAGIVEHFGKLEYDYQQARHSRERKLGWIAHG
jgi:hypothetical protein